MSNFLQLTFELAIILFAAKLAGHISTRFNQPSVLGEILVGLILGPTLLNVTHFPFITSPYLLETINELGEMGVMLLMFMAGLELHVGELMRNSRVSAYAGTLGVFVPVTLGWLTGLLMGLANDHALFLGLTLGATSVSISAQTLMELKVLRSQVGLGMLGAAVFDDVLVILLLSAFLALFEGSGGVIGILWIVIKMALFLTLSVAVGYWGLPRLANRISRLSVGQGIITLAIVVMLLYGLAAELLGQMAAITGAFLAGLMFGRTPHKKSIENGLRSLSYGFFVPIFFVNIGLTVNLRELGIETLWGTIAISLVAILGKLLGAGMGARLGHYSWREALQLGIGMVSRGEVGLIVAKVGLDAGLLSAGIFSAVIGMVIITTLVTPPMLRAAFAGVTPLPNRPAVPIKETV